MKKLALSLAAIAILAGSILYVFRETVSFALVSRVINQRLTDQLSDLEDGLHIGLCGTGSPFPDPRRAAPCTVVVAGRQVLLFDSGSGASKQLSLMDLNAGLVDHVFLTHFHSDHIDGLGELMMTRWAQRREDNRLSVHGPEGVHKVVAGFEQAYQLDTGYRTAHHGAQTMPTELAGADVVQFGPASDAPLEVFNNQGLLIQAIQVNHHPVEPAVAYRIEYKGRVAVISGDTAPSEVLAKAAQGADLLIHEALHPGLVKRLEQAARNNNRPRLAKILSDIPDYHTTPVQAAELAQRAGVTALVYNHIVPPLPLPPLEDVFLEGTDQAFGGLIHLGKDGDWITLLPQTRRIELGRRWNF